MKLKEQLAAQYLGSLENEDGLSHREIEIFISGFEKARAMAIQIMSDTPHALFRLRDMGEEEVE